MKYILLFGYLVPMSINFHFFRYTCLASKLTAHPSSHNFPEDMRQRSFMDGKTCIHRSTNKNCGMGRGPICDDCIFVSYGCSPHIPFRTGVLLVTSTIPPQKMYYAYRVYSSAGSYRCILIIYLLNYLRDNTDQVAIVQDCFSAIRPWC